MDGLSADKLRVLLHPVKDTKDEDEIDTEDVIEDEKSVEMISKEVFELQFKDNKVLATLNDGTRGLWKSAQVMYSYPLPHKVGVKHNNFRAKNTYSKRSIFEIFWSSQT